jgi:hypothetical protein
MPHSLTHSLTRAPAARPTPSTGRARPLENSKTCNADKIIPRYLHSNSTNMALPWSDCTALCGYSDYTSELVLQRAPQSLALAGAWTTPSCWYQSGGTTLVKQQQRSSLRSFFVNRFIVISLSELTRPPFTPTHSHARRRRRRWRRRHDHPPTDHLAWVNGKGRSRGVSVVRRLAAALGVPSLLRSGTMFSRCLNSCLGKPPPDPGTAPPPPAEPGPPDDNNDDDDDVVVAVVRITGER